MLVAIAVLALASQAEVPAYPVPFTLQTLAVILTGFLLGPTLAFAATCAWLVAGAAGLPLFSGGSGGPDSFTGPTAGYLVSFPFAAALAGWLADTRRDASALRLFAAGIAAHVLVLAVGGLWLSALIGASPAWEKGVWPFVPSAFLKSAAAAALAKLYAAVSGTGAQARSR
jgi:biotin transport system substrate-specific component